MARTQGKRSKKKRSVRTKRQALARASSIVTQVKNQGRLGGEKPTEFSELVDGEVTVIERRPRRPLVF